MVHVNDGKVMWVSSDHTPSRKDEVAAILKRGGRIAEAEPTWRHGKYFNADRVFSNNDTYALAVTRAIGDRDWKMTKEGEFNILSSIPEQMTGKFKDSDFFIIACDGMVLL